MTNSQSPEIAMKLLFVLPMVATAGCCQVEECGTTAIERMPTVKFEAVTPATCAKPCGDAKVWDFTAGLPAGGKLRKGGRLTAEGLHAADVTNMVIASGYMLDNLWTPEGAFLFEAEFVPGTLGGAGAPPPPPDCRPRPSISPAPTRIRGRSPTTRRVRFLIGRL